MSTDVKLSEVELGKGSQPPPCDLGIVDGQFVEERHSFGQKFGGSVADVVPA